MIGSAGECPRGDCLSHPSGWLLADPARIIALWGRMSWVIASSDFSQEAGFPDFNVEISQFLNLSAEWILPLVQFN